MTDQTTISQKYRVCSDPVNDIWRLYSFWSMAEDVVLSDGTDLQTKIDSLKDGVDTASTDAVDIPKKGTKTHEKLQERFEDMEKRYKDKIGEIENLITDLSPDGTTIPGWDLLVDILNMLVSDTEDLTDDMMRDLEYFDPSNFASDLTLSQSDHDYLAKDIEELTKDEADAYDEVMKIIGDTSQLDYMVADGTQTTDTRLAPLILHHQDAIKTLKEMATPLDWVSIPASEFVTPTSFVSSVTGSVRYQKDTGLIATQVTFNTSGTVYGGATQHIGTIQTPYLPISLCSGDTFMYNTTFIVQIKVQTAYPDMLGVVFDNGDVYLYNRGATNYTGNIPMYVTYVGQIVSS